MIRKLWLISKFMTSQYIITIHSPTDNHAMKFGQLKNTSRDIFLLKNDAKNEGEDLRGLFLFFFLSFI